MKKVIPAERFSSFVVHHYYCWEKIKDYKLVHSVDSHLKAGLVQMSNIRGAAGYYDGLQCWKDIIQEYRSHLVTADALVIRYVDDKQVYLLEKGKKRKIKNGAVFEKRGFQWKDVLVVEHKAVFDALPLGPDVDD